ncbi:thioesterase II family protein [Gloeobacter morelensis]|uniref:Thioesterase n=1 Tax=Gloeobacter morelensis MG652769 TaxID=2781736 RepID=A0ABY3PLZ7_9CYAN|nr:alpha/beta fold hydrolase [Gloeobacter morelensis]UFP94711.1 thioesterase [Gloeobacter morelensis MG652769]
MNLPNNQLGSGPYFAAAEWFRWCTPNPGARLRLFCFPHAGCGASVYREWRTQLPEAIEVRPCQLPGRENLTRLPMPPRLPELIDIWVSVLAPHLDRPFAFFGHSMGALVSFELARQLRRQHLPLPVCLLVASRRAPQLSSPMPTGDLLSEEALLAWVRKVGGTPEALLAHPKWREHYLGILRADLRLSEHYLYRPEPPLDCPLFVYGGTHDTVVTHPQLSAWREQTASTFALQMLPGGHIFDPPMVQQQLASMADRLGSFLS